MNEESAIAAARRTGLRRCSADACQQGRDRCPCPSECAMPEDDDTFSRDLAGAIVIVAVLALLAAVLPAVFA